MRPPMLGWVRSSMLPFTRSCIRESTFRWRTCGAVVTCSTQTHEVESSKSICLHFRYFLMRALQIRMPKFVPMCVTAFQIFQFFFNFFILVAGTYTSYFTSEFNETVYSNLRVCQTPKNIIIFRLPVWLATILGQLCATHVCVVSVHLFAILLQRIHQGTTQSACQEGVIYE